MMGLFCRAPMNLMMIVLIGFLVSMNLVELVHSKYPEVPLNLGWLPEPITRYTFPGSYYCDDLLGCTDIDLGKYPMKPELMGTKFYVYSNSSTEGSLIRYEPTRNCLNSTSGLCANYPYDLEKLNQLEINVKQPFVIITSGFHSKPETTWQKSLRDIFRQYNDSMINVINVAWPNGNSGGRFGIDYQQARSNTPIVARQITAFIYYLANVRGMIDPLYDRRFAHNLHLIGHSLGAHISGFVGKDFKGMIGRITGLDPAGPSFVSDPRRKKLDRQDAKLVEVLHTNGRPKTGGTSQLGHLDPLGHVDYYLNDGEVQPREFCDYSIGNFICYHKLATLVYTLLLQQELNNMIMFGQKFEPMYSYPSDSYKKFINGNSFGERCSKYAMPNDLNDLIDRERSFYSCALPMKFLSPLDETIAALSKYENINFDSLLDPINRTYFIMERKRFDEQLLVRVKFARRNEPDFNPQSYSVLKVYVTLFFDYDETVSYNNDHLIDLDIDSEGSYNILSPVTFVQTSDSARVIRELISNEYYLEDGNSNITIEAIKRIFPYKMKVQAYKDWDKSIVNKIRAITMTTLTYGNRSILVSYSENNSKLIDLIVLGSNDTMPDLDPLKKFNNYPYDELPLVLDKIIIGPRHDV